MKILLLQLSRNVELYTEVANTKLSVINNFKVVLETKQI